MIRFLESSPTNDFAYKKVFGSQANELVLISLLNAILNLPRRISAVTIENPLNYQDFYEDKLSVLDIKAVDEAGAIYGTSRTRSKRRIAIENTST